jgi:hypothetical protein
MELNLTAKISESIVKAWELLVKHPQSNGAVK